MAKINRATAGIMLAAVIGGGAIGAAAIPAMAADGTGTSSSSSSTAGNGYGMPDGGAGGPHGQHQANGKTQDQGQGGPGGHQDGGGATGMGGYSNG